jgi:hypothetical protein
MVDSSIFQIANSPVIEDSLCRNLSGKYLYHVRTFNPFPTLSSLHYGIFKKKLFLRIPTVILGSNEEDKQFLL